MKSENRKQSTVKRINLIPRIVCFLFAFVLWVYVMMVDSPDHEETFEDVPVTLVGTAAVESEKNLSVFSGSDITVDVTVKGQKSVISRYSKEDITVNADVSGVTKGGRSTFNLYFDLPSGLSLVSSSANTVDLFIDRKTSINVDVVPKLSSYKVATDYEIGEITCDVDVISVTGPESVLGDISYALVEADMSDSYISESLVTDCAVTLVNSNDESVETRYLKLSQSSVNVSVPVYAYKEVELKADYKYGYFNSKNTEIRFSPATVRIKGDPTKLEGLESLSVTTLDEKSISENSSFVVDIITPADITLADGEPASATLSVTRLNMKKRDIIVKNIKVDYDKNMTCEVLTGSVNVTIVADSDIAMNLSADDITLYADMRGFTGSKGTVLVPAEVRINTESGMAYELGSYNVQVKVG